MERISNVFDMRTKKSPNHKYSLLQQDQADSAEHNDESGEMFSEYLT